LKCDKRRRNKTNTLKYSAYLSKSNAEFLALRDLVDIRVFSEYF
jgi:hypothetical protein